MPVPLAGQVCSWAGCPASKLGGFPFLFHGDVVRKCGEVPSAGVFEPPPRCSSPAGLGDPSSDQLCISTRGYGLVIKELAGEEGRGKGF